MIGNLVGNYEITDKIGEGGVGAVYKGVDLVLEREVAIKALRPEWTSQPEIVERFRAEAVTLARLNHPNIATLYNFLNQDDTFFMIMEFVRGETLDNLIRRTGAMRCRDAISLLCQALEGIGYAHRHGVVHRDIKPANLMLTDTGFVKVMDFGIARVLGTARMTRQGHIVGTIEYMSPEQVIGQEGDARSDVYSLGIVMYEMLTGRVPFESDSEYNLMKMQIEAAPVTPKNLGLSLPPSVESTMMRALAKSVDERFQSASEFRQALLGAVEPPGIPAAQADYPQIGYQSGFDSVSANPPKETRLAPEPAGNQVATVLGTPHISESAGEIRAHSSPASGKLKAKHYVVAGILLVGVLAVLFFVISSLKPPGNQDRIGSRTTSDNANGSQSSLRTADRTPSPKTPDQKSSLGSAMPAPSLSPFPSPSPVLPASSSNEIVDTLRAWAGAVRAHDLDAHMSYYADTLDVYHGSHNAKASRVRADLERAFSRYSTLDIRLTNINVTVDSGPSAVATFDKTWNFSGRLDAPDSSEHNYAGSVREMVWLTRVGTRWRITGLKDL
jgi:serine/threonine protein kinase